MLSRKTERPWLGMLTKRRELVKTANSLATSSPTVALTLDQTSFGGWNGVEGLPASGRGIDST